MRQQLSGLLYGWVVILSIILLTSIILALLLRFTAFNEPTLSWVTLIIGLFAFFFGGLIAGVKGKTKGWMIGGLTGIGFSFFIFLIQYLGYKSGFSMEQLFSHIGYVFVALLGGVIGVNIVVEQQD